MNACIRLTALVVLWYNTGILQVFGQTKTWKNSVFSELEKKQYHFHNRHHNSFVATNKMSVMDITCAPLTQCISVNQNKLAYTLQLSAIRLGSYEMPLYDQPAFIASNNHLSEQHRYFSIDYLNNEKGLKQNFVLPQKVNAGTTIEVEMNFLSDRCRPVLQCGAISIQEHETGHSKEIARYEALKVYDAHNRILPAFFEMRQGKIIIVVNQENAVYPITIDPLSNTPSTQVNGTQVSMQMGYCVSGAGDVNGDGYSDVIVGASKYDNGEANEGAAFVYLGSGNGLATTPAWSVESNQTAAEFGINVSEAGDVNGDGYGDVIVGASHYTNGQYQEGRVYVYHGSASGLSTTANWTYESDQDTAELGFIVSTAGDVNGDGFSDVVVGSPQYNNGQINEGIALIFHGSATGLAATPNNTLEQNQAGSCFGWSVCSAGDVNADGYADVIISASYFDNGHHDEGKAWVYAGSATGINTTPIWTHESNKVDAYYGENVSWAGDLNGDGYGDIVVGADYATQGQTDEGLTYVYHGSTTGPATSPTIVLERNQAGAAFGVGVNGAGDVNGDGYGDLIVGAYFYTNGQSFEGTAFVYYGSSTGVSQTLFTLLEANQANASYGISVCSAGDVNGDGFSDVVVGAYFYDQTTPTTVTNGGAFFVYNGKPESIGTTAVTGMPYTLTQADANLGNFVTCVGDVNGDGFSDMAVGANSFDNVQANRGVVYIFHGSATGYAALPNTTIDGPAMANTAFGASIGAAGDVNGDGYSDIIVGATGYSSGQIGEGAFFIYLGSASGINTTAHLSVESNITGATLGFSVSGAGDVNGDGYSDVVVGANGYTNGQTNEGSAYVYYGSATGVDATADWQYETDVSSERLGACVAGVGDANGDGYSDLVVLSSGYSNGQSSEGRMFYFLGDVTGLATTPICTFETDVANSGINAQSCTYIGDINGDGFNEVVIGMSSFNNGATTNEGVLRIYYGATPNLNFSTVQNVEGNATDFLLGATVGFGGDVNGDGYNDVMTGAPTFNNGATTNEGIARVYLGAAGGLASSPAYTFEGNTTGYSVGSSVSAAGDINGDGYSDILIGAKDYDAGAAPLNTGRVYAFFGNNSHGIRPMTMKSQQYKSDLFTVVQSSNGTFETNCNFGISHGQKAHLGRERARLLYEVRGHPHPFSSSGSLMGNSVSFSAIQGSYTTVELAGVNFTMGASAIPPMGFPKWRTRVKFHMLDALDGQLYGRWFYGSIHDKQDRSIKVSLVTCGVLPVDMSAYQVTCDPQQVQVQWTMATEDNVAAYEIYTSADGRSFEKTVQVPATGEGQYAITIEKSDEVQLVKLVTVDNNQYAHEQFTVVPDCKGAADLSLLVYPNPSGSVVNVSIPGWDKTRGEIMYTLVTDINGREVYRYQGQAVNIDLSTLATGVYQLSLLTDRGKKFSARFVRM